jgi:hypothetical protein
MRKLFFGIALLSLVSCAKKKWDKETLKAKFLKEFKSNDKTKVLGEEMLAKISDCTAEKIVAKYKTESEANKDKAGVQEISMNCTLEAMGMGEDKPTEMTPMNDTIPG